MGYPNGSVLRCDWIQVLFDLCYYFWCFAPSFALTAAPPNCQLIVVYSFTLRKPERNWNGGSGNAATMPVVITDSSIGRLKGSDTLETESCHDPFECTLIQGRPERTQKPMSYWLSSLGKAEQAYNTRRRELFAFVRSVWLLEPYLTRLQLTAQTCSQRTSMEL